MTVAIVAVIRAAIMRVFIVTIAFKLLSIATTPLVYFSTPAIGLSWMFFSVWIVVGHYASLWSPRAVPTRCVRARSTMLIALTWLPRMSPVFKALSLVFSCGVTFMFWPINDTEFTVVDKQIAVGDLVADGDNDALVCRGDAHVRPERCRKVEDRCINRKHLVDHH